ncbi:hypothetical protein RB595_010226 [Gaeumannomyces hyphopodioides]
MPHHTRTPKFLQRARETLDSDTCSDFRTQLGVVDKVAITMSQPSKEQIASNGNVAGTVAVTSPKDWKQLQTAGFKQAPPTTVENGDYVKSMINVYRTSQNLAADIENEIPLFVNKARQRILCLIDIIAKLKKELYDAKVEVIRANNRIHMVLRRQEFQDDYGWEEGLEAKIMMAETPDEIDQAMGKPPGDTDTSKQLGDADTSKPPGDTDTSKPPGDTDTGKQPGDTDTGKQPGDTDTGPDKGSSG